MTDELTQAFEDFAHGVISPETFEHGLLMLCKTTPDRAWEALAMLDQHFRRGKIPRELEYTVRQRLERQALGIESYQPQPTPLRRFTSVRAIAVAPDADAEDPTIETNAAAKPPAPPAIALPCAPARATVARATVPRLLQTRTVAASLRWRPYLRISPAIALTAVMLAVAVPPTVNEGQKHGLAIDAGAADAPAAVANGDASAAASARRPEPGPDMLSLSSDRYIVDPVRDVAELSVERSPDATGDTSFLWWTEGSGAKPAQDYIAGKPQRMQMAEGVGTSTLRIPILVNPNRRHVEMFYVLIGRPQGTTGVGPIHRAAVFLLPQRAR
jgi:hypothetical protein